MWKIGFLVSRKRENKETTCLVFPKLAAKNFFLLRFGMFYSLPNFLKKRTKRISFGRAEQIPRPQDQLSNVEN
jgi:hypothetical protein